MTYPSLKNLVDDLDRHKQLIRIDVEIDPFLEAAEIHRRVNHLQGPAVYFANLKNCKFPAVSNIFGTDERCRFIFRKTLQRTESCIELRSNPKLALTSPRKFLGAAWHSINAIPKISRTGPVFANQTTIDALPQIVSWPLDGGPFITLPQVLTEDPHTTGPMHSNLGMYRSQMSGNSYEKNRQIGMHYQIHRGIGIHHAAAIKKGEPLRVCIFVGGPPAHTIAAIMPLPEGFSECIFAGLLAGRRMRFARRDGYLCATESDFCIVGKIDIHTTLPEGPFGDHLGYYSLKHNFPVLNVERVYHRKDAIWPFTVVGRPPQEDSQFGKLIHDLTSSVVPREIKGVKALRAVDEAGVHPLLLAIGSERYVPYGTRYPQELLTIANAILGFGQCSLAKYLWIAACEDDPTLDLTDIKRFFSHVLSRVDWSRDLHFQTRTTIDTLDYSGTDLNSGSKLVIACAGRKSRNLANIAPKNAPRPTFLVSEGILAMEIPAFRDQESAADDVKNLEKECNSMSLDGIALIVLVNSLADVRQEFGDFLWVTFTRSNPSHDVYGFISFFEHKHFGCYGPLVIDARIKPHHAPPLESDPIVKRRVDNLFSSHEILSKLAKGAT